MTNNLVLHMGFINTPYIKQNIKAPMAAARAHEKKSSRHYSKTKTAQQISKILEDRYGIINIFQSLYEPEIEELVTLPLRDLVIEALSDKRKFTSERMVQYMKPKTQEIEKMFRKFLDRGETGIVTQASIKAGRQSFINTGIYRASFRAYADIA